MKNIIKTLFLFMLILTCNSVFSQKFTPVTEIPEGTALVYIYNSSGISNSFVNYTINANDEKVSEALLKRGTYLIYFAKPGRYTFWGEYIGTRKAVDLDVVAGKTYYISGDAYSLSIPVTEEAQKQIKKCKLSKVKNKK